MTDARSPPRRAFRLGHVHPGGAPLPRVNVTRPLPGHRLTAARRGYLSIMSPRMWRLMISGSLRLFLISSVPAAAHLSVLAGLAAAVIAFVVPAPRGRHDDRVGPGG
jgi:hypothetical protein